MAQQPDANSNSMITEEMWFAVFVIFISVAGWWVMHGVITSIYSIFWFVEMFVVGIFTDNLAVISKWVHETPYNEVTFDQFAATSSYVGYYSRFFWAPIIIGLGVYTYLHDSGSKFKREHTFDSLVKIFAKTWPHASMLYNKDIKSNSVPGKDRGPGMKAREFAKRYRLLDEEGDIREEEAEDIFIRQLGPQFNGVDVWKKRDTYKLAIVALCIMKYTRAYDDFTILRNTLAEAFHKKGHIKSCYPLVIEMYEKHAKTIVSGDKRTLIDRLKGRHAYEYTFLYSLFGASKRAVFAPNEFAWLKLINRTLWYTLNSVDRRVAWTEAAAPKAQWYAEVVGQRAIKTPVLTEAIVGLKEAINEIKERETDA